MQDSAILITGANGGIGKFLVRYFLERGHRNLACHYRNGSGELRSLLRSFDLDDSAHTFQADLRDEKSIAEMARAIESKYPFVEKVLNVAGSSTNAMSWKMTKLEFQNVVEDNLLSAFLCSKQFIPNMRSHQRGRIVNFSSVVAFTGIAGSAHYCAAKAGLVGLTKGLALELAPKNITVNAIALGYFGAGLIEAVPEAMQKEILQQIPMRRFGAYADIGAAAEYLISEGAAFFTGQVLHLNGGQN